MQLTLEEKESILFLEPTTSVRITGEDYDFEIFKFTFFTIEQPKEFSVRTFYKNGAIKSADYFSTPEEVINFFEPKIGRPSKGITKKVSVTLPEEDWFKIQEAIEHEHAASVSDYFRQLHQSVGSGWRP